ncbi:MAG TPA: hypothetical protein VHG32_27350 [Thermoanaerobaculia bacterium]|jgi:hypothetical protein|nr:hypothetical protein [Thermoanaerobaculia bacterium]
MNGPARRVFLARDAAWMERVRVYRTDEALEVAHISYVEVSLTRVFFDEVRLLTLHRYHGGRILWLLMALTALCGLGLLAGNSVPEIYNFFLVVTLAVAAWTLVTALLPRSIVTVYGKRARARMRFPYRAGKARRVYDDLCRRVGEAQARVRAAAAPAVPSPPEEPWPFPAAAAAPPEALSSPEPTAPLEPPSSPEPPSPLEPPAPSAPANGTAPGPGTLLS